MNIKELVKIAMVKADVDGVTQLMEVTGKSYYICDRALKGDNTLQVKYVVDILASLGFSLKADISKLEKES